MPARRCVAIAALSADSTPSPPPLSVAVGGDAAKSERTSLLNPPYLAGWRHASPDIDGTALTPRPRPRPRPRPQHAACPCRRWCSGTVCCCVLTGLATLAATVLSFQPIIVETLWPVSEPPPPPPNAKAGSAYLRNAQGAYLMSGEGVGSNASAASAEESARLASVGDGDRRFFRSELPVLAAVQTLLVCACVVCCSRRHAAHGHLLQQQQQQQQHALPGARQAADERATPTEPEQPEAEEAPPGQEKEF